MTMFTTIVVAIDFSGMSHDVLRYGARLASDSPGSRLHLVHVVPDPLQQLWTVESIAIDFEMLQQTWVTDAHARLQALAAAEGVPAASFTPAVLVGQAAEAILAFAAERSADVIVVGTHGYGPVKRFLLGSVAERVLRGATCPVLTVPPTGLQAPDH